MLEVPTQPFRWPSRETAEPRRWLTEPETTTGVGPLLGEPLSGISTVLPPRPVRVTAAGGKAALTVSWEGPEPFWLRPTLEVLAELLALPRDWDSYGARPVAQAAVGAAVSLLRDVMPAAAPAPQVVPTSAGGVQLEWHLGGIDLEVSVRPSGEAFVLFDDLRTGEEWEGILPVRRAALAAALAALVQRS